MKSIALLGAAGAALFLVFPALSGEIRTSPKAVIELFTSQGCSSCPKADAMFNELGKRQDVVALAWHVDYWDYIGWADTFGARENSDRQRGYAESWGSARIYTPQMIVNGTAGVIGSHGDEVDEALGAAELTLPVSMDLTTEALEITIGPRAGAQDATVWLVTFKDSSEVTIERGENAGSTFDYTQIVTGKQMLGMWDADAGSQLKLPISALRANGSNGAAILVQSGTEELPGAILGAASIQL